MEKTIQSGDFDCEVCIELVLNKDASEVDRIAAAESLMWCATESAKDALFKVVMDEEEEEELREQTAGSLGSLWAESQINYKRIAKIPERFLPELMHDFPILEVEVDPEELKKFK